MTCKDCIHEVICDEYCETLNLCQPANCGMFKDASRFVELPCKCGDTVYILRNNNKPRGCEVVYIGLSADETCNHINFVENFEDGTFRKTHSVSFSEIGRYVFLTPEEALKADAGAREQCVR